MEGQEHTPEPALAATEVFEPPVGWRTKARHVGATVARVALRLGVILPGGIAGAEAAGPATTTIGPAVIESRINFDMAGEATLELPPLGSVAADVSRGPFGATVQLRSITEDAPDILKQEFTLAQQAAEGSEITLPSFAQGDYLEQQMKELFQDTATRGAIGFLLGGIAAGIAFESLRLLPYAMSKEQLTRHQLFRRGVTAMLVPIGALGLGAGLTLASFDKDAFKTEPKLDGMLALAPDAVQQGIASLDNYRGISAQFTGVIQNLNNLTSIVRELNILPEDTDGLVPILIVGDIHSQPCAYQRAELLREGSGAVLVINVGDETEWGLDFENTLFASQQCEDDSPAKLSTDMVFVKGNHDSHNTVAHMKQFPNVTVLEGKSETVFLDTEEGLIPLRLIGDGDPRFTPYPWDRPSLSVEKQMVASMGERLGHTALSSLPDLLVVHDPAAARAAHEVMAKHDRTIPYAVAGHTHNFATEENLTVVDSFGMSGLRGYEGNARPAGAVVLYLDPKTKEVTRGKRLVIQANGSFSTEWFTPITSHQELQLASE